MKPAPADAPTAGLMFMIGLGKQLPPRGLLTMTGPLAPFITFAYDVDDEVEARAMRARLPEWAQRQKYTIVARPPQDSPTQEQLRIMIRGLLAERFALKAHRESHTATANTLLVVKPGMTGPDLKPHDPAQVCIQRSSNETPAAPEPSQPAPVYCGLDLRRSTGGIFHVSMIDVSLPEACTLLGGLAGVLGGREMEKVVDGTGLQGKWDIHLQFLPETGAVSDASSSDVSGPSFTAALAKQLGLRLKRGNGTVEDLIVDHIAEPAPD